MYGGQCRVYGRLSEVTTSKIVQQGRDGGNPHYVVIGSGTNGTNVVTGRLLIGGTFSRTFIKLGALGTRERGSTSPQSRYSFWKRSK